MTNVSDYPITVDGVRLDTLGKGVEASSLTLGGLRSADTLLAGLDGVVASVDDSREPSSLSLSMFVRGTDDDGLVPFGQDGQAVYQENLQTLKHLLAKSGTLLDVRRVVDKATTTAHTNLFMNPGMRATSGNVEVRRNHCKNPGFEVDLTHWLRLGNFADVAHTRDTAVMHSGVASLKVVANGVASAQGAYYSPSTVGAPYVQGQPFTVSAWVNAPAGAALEVLAASLGTGAANGTVPFVGTGAWQRVSATGTMGATLNPYILIRTTTATAVTFYVDDVLLEPGSTLYDWFSGSSVAGGDFTAYAWAGTVGLSESIAYALSVPYALSDFPVFQTTTGGRKWVKSLRGSFLYASVAGVIGRYYAATVLIGGPPGTDYAVGTTDNVAASWTDAAVGVFPPSGEVRIALPSTNPVGGPSLNLGLFGGAGGERITEILVEEVAGPGIAPTAYFDGTSVGSGWNGTPDDSTSTRDSSDLQAWAKVQDAITPEDHPGDVGRLGAVLMVPGVYWRSVLALTWSQAAVNPGTAYEVASLQGSSAPVDDAVVCLTGPANAGAQVIDDATGSFVRLNEAIPAGSTWRVNVATWESRMGVGLTVASADTDGTDKSGVTDQGGLYPRLLRLNPRLSAGARRVKVRTAGGGFTAATTLTIKARRAHL